MLCIVSTIEKRKNIVTIRLQNVSDCFVGYILRNDCDILPQSFTIYPSLPVAPFDCHRYFHDYLCQREINYSEE